MPEVPSTGSRCQRRWLGPSSLFRMLIPSFGCAVVDWLDQPICTFIWLCRNMQWYRASNEQHTSSVHAALLHSAGAIISTDTTASLNDTLTCPQPYLRARDHCSSKRTGQDAQILLAYWLMLKILSSCTAHGVLQFCANGGISMVARYQLHSLIIGCHDRKGRAAT
jgi:hypothetical protein